MEIYVVGTGAGSEDGLTRGARKTLEGADLIVGYTVYTDLVKSFLPQKECYSTGMRGEKERCIYAINAAREGKRVCVVCGGDAGVYGMTSLLYELTADDADIEIRAVAGVSAMLSGAALVGAPLGHDFAVISLSDLLTPWETIEKRLVCAAEGDFVICLYNPSSKNRADYLRQACSIIMKYRDTKTVCAAARNIGRDGEEYAVMTLGEMADYKADMFTTVFIGSTKTREIKGRMVTPRGYK